MTKKLITEDFDVEFPLGSTGEVIIDATVNPPPGKSLTTKVKGKAVLMKSCKFKVINYHSATVNGAPGTTAAPFSFAKTQAKYTKANHDTVLLDGDKAVAIQVTGGHIPPIPAVITDTIDIIIHAKQTIAKGS